MNKDLSDHSSDGSILQPSYLQPTLPVLISQQNETPIKTRNIVKLQNPLYKLDPSYPGANTT